MVSLLYESSYDASDCPSAKIHAHIPGRRRDARQCGIAHGCAYWTPERKPCRNTCKNTSLILYGLAACGASSDRKGGRLPHMYRNQTADPGGKQWL